MLLRAANKTHYLNKLHLQRVLQNYNLIHPDANLNLKDIDKNTLLKAIDKTAYLNKKYAQKIISSYQKEMDPSMVVGNKQMQTLINMIEDKTPKNKLYEHLTQSAVVDLNTQVSNFKKIQFEKKFLKFKKLLFERQTAKKFEYTKIMEFFEYLKYIDQEHADYQKKLKAIFEALETKKESYLQTLFKSLISYDYLFQGEKKALDTVEKFKSMFLKSSDTLEHWKNYLHELKKLKIDKDYLNLNYTATFKEKAFELAAISKNALKTAAILPSQLPILYAESLKKDESLTQKNPKYFDKHLGFLLQIKNRLQKEYLDVIEIFSNISDIKIPLSKKLKNNLQTGLQIIQKTCFELTAANELAWNNFFEKLANETKNSEESKSG